ncbi:hypothetical protein SHKM778_31480 [Streptomyces sp. KM77-8]|uniref:Allantoicase domain-containing protein n=1 Tax=Streptomyces haneummycinicus TaxID=3074435 RepID=A0AAT9HGZ8_9ACTN
MTLERQDRNTVTAIESFTGDARPYNGGDPYADYRTADFPFTGLADLADRRLGAGVVAANDEFFAQRENLLLPGRAEFEPGRFGHKGKIMDGWETRRRRGASAEHPWPADGDHDWALIRLGAAGVVRGSSWTPRTSVATTRRPSPSRARRRQVSRPRRTCSRTR